MWLRECYSGLPANKIIRHTMINGEKTNGRTKKFGMAKPPEEKINGTCVRHISFITTFDSKPLVSD
jgi:hypothetical protein